MSGHTPGPWMVSPLDGRAVGPFRQISTPEGAMVRQLQAVAVVKEGTNETAANASLIAAAPELLAACRALVEGEDDVPVMDLARAAIAKAEGRS